MNAGTNAEGAEKLQRAQRECGGERKRRRSYAEVAKEIPKLFGKGLNQCLCGLQGINGWEGVWGLVVGGFYGFALRRLEGYGATTQKAQRLRRSRRRDTKLFEKACKQYPCGLQAKNGWEGAWMLVVGVLPLIVATACVCLAAGAARGGMRAAGVRCKRGRFFARLLPAICSP